MWAPLGSQRFYQILGKRLGKFGLTLEMDKTNIINFSRLSKRDNTSFEFLGFEFRWGVSLRGTRCVKKRTSRKKLRESLGNFKNWCNKNRNLKLKELFQLINAKLRGYYNYKAWDVNAENHRATRETTKNDVCLAVTVNPRVTPSRA
jgi:RNA-directed DNA polymerase